jgi:hypothetical protein
MDLYTETEDLELVRKAVETVFLSTFVIGFRYSKIVKLTHLGPNEALEGLTHMVENGEIGRIYEVMCDNEDCLHVLDKVSSEADVHPYYLCTRCGNEVESPYVEPIFIRATSTEE